MSEQASVSIGDFIISNTMGIGRILSVEVMGNHDNKFFVIEAVKDKSKLMVPIASEGQIRKLATAEELENGLEYLKSGPLPEHDFDSRKDRIHYFKDKQKDVHMQDSLDLLLQVFQAKDKNKIENSIFENLVQTYSTEMSFVMDISQDEAKQKIEGILDQRLQEMAS